MQGGLIFPREGQPAQVPARLNQVILEKYWDSCWAGTRELS